MADIKAFRAIRPAAAYAAEIAALPYDVYSASEARRETAGKPLSFLCIDRAETQLPEGTDPYSGAVYQKAAALFWSEVEKGYFIRDPEDCYYIYALTMNGRTQAGIVACTAVSDYLEERCKKHENTVVKKEEDRIRHVEALKAQTGPIFLTYHRDAVISDLVKEAMKEPPVYDFTSEDGIRHTVFRIADAARVQEITKRFSEAVVSTYIADGHHRAASAVKAALSLRKQNEKNEGKADNREKKPAEYDYFLSVLFPDDELLIMDYNRVVKDWNGLSEEEFLQRAGELYEIGRMPKEELDEAGVPREKPKQKGELHVYFGSGRTWYRFRLKAKVQAAREKDPVGTLDASALQELLLAPLFGIEDPRTDERIEFVGGIRGRKILMEKAERCGGIAFSMHPTSIGELMAVADAGRLMPPKSTWFEPKLRSGLFIHSLLG